MHNKDNRLRVCKLLVAQLEVLAAQMNSKNWQEAANTLLMQAIAKEPTK
jgi:hypothetical protein